MSPISLLIVSWIIPLVNQDSGGPVHRESMLLEVMTCIRLVTVTALVNSSHNPRPSPVDCRSSRTAIGVREPSADQRVVMPLK